MKGNNTWQKLITCVVYLTYLIIQTKKTWKKIYNFYTNKIIYYIVKKLESTDISLCSLVLVLAYIKGVWVHNNFSKSCIIYIFRDRLPQTGTIWPRERKVGREKKSLFPSPVQPHLGLIFDILIYGNGNSRSRLP